MSNYRPDDVTPLTKLNGSGKYLTVEAWVNHIIDLNTHNPAQKGLLGDDSLSRDEKRLFVVSRGSGVDRLEKGNKYRLENVKDHYYENQDEIQIMITEQSRVKTLYEG
ncbi:hypothetical protein ACLI4Q_03905 [Natrialbaceae archaeon A-CW1-1]